MGLGDVKGKEPVVAAVGLPKRYRRRRRGWGSCRQSVRWKRLVQHSDQRDVGQPLAPMLQARTKEGQDAGQDISEAGDETDDAIDTKANAGTRYDEGFVEKDFQLTKAFVAQEAGSSSTPAIAWSDWSLDDAPGLVWRHWIPQLECGRMVLPLSFDATIKVTDGGYSSAAERLTVAQDVVGSIPTSRPSLRLDFPNSSGLHTGAEGGPGELSAPGVVRLTGQALS